MTIKWIDVIEEIPETKLVIDDDEDGMYTYFKSEPVIVFINTDRSDERFKIATYQKYEKRSIWADEEDGSIVDALYWMPLPKLPNEVED